MARKRMIDPEVWTDKRFAFLTEGEQILFLALITQADDEGRLVWEATEIKLRCFPASDVSVDILENRLKKLTQTELAYQYESDGRAILILTGWFKNQKLDHPALFKLPDPPDFTLNSSLREYSRGLASVRESSRKVSKPREDSRESASLRSNKEKKVREISKKDLSADKIVFAELEGEVEAFLSVFAGKNKTGAISDGREVTIRREVKEFQDEIGDDAAFVFGLREAIRHDADSVNYAKKAAESYRRRSNITPLPSVRQPDLTAGFEVVR